MACFLAKCYAESGAVVSQQLLDSKICQVLEYYLWPDLQEDKLVFVAKAAAKKNV